VRRRPSVRLVLAIANATILLFPVVAYAWSNPGHETVCQIAYLELTKPTQQKVRAILKSGAASSEFRTLSSACTWADSDKYRDGSVQNARRNDHFINVQRRQPTISTAVCPLASTCLFTAIDKDLYDLKTQRGLAQLEALRFLGHWIGDIHQPMHVSFEDDRGGNDLPVAGVECAEMHATWDRCLPDRLLRSRGKRSYTALGKSLYNEITALERSTWQRGSVVEWAAETYAITRRADLKYCARDGDSNSCCYPDGHLSNCARDGNKVTVRLDGQYLDAHVEVVAQQMKMAGVRLAKLLEESL
jgi:hypothetical protein